MKGIACNLLVNVAILLAISSKNMVGKFFGIWFPIMAFVASGLRAQRGQHVLYSGRYFCGCERHVGSVYILEPYPCYHRKHCGRFHFYRGCLLLVLQEGTFVDVTYMTS
ncbi:MAG: formate/nitrite transporter family protein [Desulfobacterales bacterium]|nr:formate/nitrite transporter family protein [Desulfobacterales bacterium]